MPIRGEAINARLRLPEGPPASATPAGQGDVFLSDGKPAFRGSDQVVRPLGGGLDGFLEVRSVPDNDAGKADWLNNRVDAAVIPITGIMAGGGYTNALQTIKPNGDWTFAIRRSGDVWLRRNAALIFDYHEGHYGPGNSASYPPDTLYESASAGHILTRGSPSYAGPTFVYEVSTCYGMDFENLAQGAIPQTWMSVPNYSPHGPLVYMGGKLMLGWGNGRKIDGGTGLQAEKVWSFDAPSGRRPRNALDVVGSVVIGDGFAGYVESESPNSLIVQNRIGAGSSMGPSPAATFHAANGASGGAAAPQLMLESTGGQRQFHFYSSSTNNLPTIAANDYAFAGVDIQVVQGGAVNYLLRADGDMEMMTASRGLVLRRPDGTRRRVRLNNSDALVIEAA
jgi:hypothetical protein